MKTIVDRMKKPTPGFLIKVAGYITVAGTVISGVSQTAVKNERK